MNARDPATMSVSSMRSELLELLRTQFPEKRWPRLVPASELAAFTLEELPTGRGGRAHVLAHSIQQRERARRKKRTTL
jgi:hypothetical protein